LENSLKNISTFVERYGIFHKNEILPKIKYLFLIDKVPAQRYNQSTTITDCIPITWNINDTAYRAQRMEVIDWKT
jgi:hypothetical protein